MPSVNVRFSDEQHEELRAAVFARGRGWSLQKEIVERLFGGALSGGAEESADQSGSVRTSGSLNGDDVAEDSPGVVAAPPLSAPKRNRSGMCEHRVPAGTFCKACGA